MSISLANRVLQIKDTMRFHLTHVQMTIIKEIIKKQMLVRAATGKSYIVGENAN